MVKNYAFARRFDFKRWFEVRRRERRRIVAAFGLTRTDTKLINVTFKQRTQPCVLRRRRSS